MMTHHRSEEHRVEVILQQRTVIYFHTSLNWLNNYIIFGRHCLRVLV